MHLRDNHEMVIAFQGYGSFFSTREQARMISPAIEDLVLNHPHVILDWDGVEMVSLAFSDELFTYMIKRIGFEAFKARTHFVNISPGVSKVISVAIGMNKPFATA